VTAKTTEIAGAPSGMKPCTKRCTKVKCSTCWWWLNDDLKNQEAIPIVKQAIPHQAIKLVKQAAPIVRDGKLAVPEWNRQKRKNHPSHSKARQCNICKKNKSANTCNVCSTTMNADGVSTYNPHAICPPEPGRGCWAAHVKLCHHD
jgi:hypothetical protein